MPIIVIPCYNEADRLDRSSFVDFSRKNPDTTFLLVNDGSNDATVSVIRSMIAEAGDRMQLLDLAQNRGKAEAVRAGILQALTELSEGYVGYWDADLATPLNAILDFIALANAKPSRRFIIGSRICRMGASIERKLLRHYFGRVFATVASNILDLPIYDTQCGAKLIEYNLAARIFSQPFISPWLFDLELIARTIITLGRPEAEDAIYEHPLTSWRDVGNSRIVLSYLPRIPYELFRIHRAYRRIL